MFKQMQTKFVEKPLLHFPPNLIKTLKLIKTIVRIQHTKSTKRDIEKVRIYF